MHNFELRMSKMEMVLGCTAGYHKSLELDRGSNEAADDGTGTHHLIDTCFKYGFKSADIFLNKTLKSSVGEYLVDKDRVERADVMLKLLFDYVDAGCTVQTEVKVEWSPSECAPIQGTCDAVIYDKDRGFLLIVDYKDGRVKVESADNAQLLMYASAFIQMNALGSLNSVDQIELCIVQPRISSEMNTSIVFPWYIRNFRRKVVEAINKIPNGVNDYCAGKWCKYCAFKGSCKTYADDALTGINTTRETVLVDSIRVTNDETPEMSDADLVALKKAAPLIKEMLVAVDKELYARAEVRAVEGVRLVEGRNNRSWNIEDEAILKKFSGLKIPKAYHHTKKVLSPAQLTKLTWVDNKGETHTLSKPQQDRFFKNNMQVIKGRPQLALSDDTRQEVNNDKRGLFKPAIQQGEK